jgi:hypothetical protein
MQKNSYYVVDPGDFEGNCRNEPYRYKAKFIMAASNDEDHWGGASFEKYRGATLSDSVLNALERTNKIHSTTNKMNLGAGGQAGGYFSMELFGKWNR